MYEIRIANETDLQCLTQFINQHWKKDHIFVTCKDLLDWQHHDQKRRRYNFIIGIERKTNAIHGVLGFIPLAQFDLEIEVERLCWMAIWKVQDEARGHKLGRNLLSYLEDTLKPEILSTVAASEMTLSMYRDRGYQTGRMSHHFILNPEKAPFQLVKANNVIPSCARVSNDDNEKVIEMISESEIIKDTAECFLLQEDWPRKTPKYLINRYLHHPIYRYQAYCLRDGTKIRGIIVTRVCSHGSSRAIRIVDFIGPADALRGLQNQWMYLLKSVDAEYIDFYSAGINGDDLLASGFIRREMGDDIVIPNYFEPFTMDNVEIDYMIKVPLGQKYRIVKGDSDQDRPNLVSGAES